MMNIECPMLNVEGRRGRDSVFLLLQHSTFGVRHSTFSARRSSPPPLPSFAGGKRSSPRRRRILLLAATGLLLLPPLLFGLISLAFPFPLRRLEAVRAAATAPLVLDRPDTPHRLLGSPVMVTMGRWSYGLFVWHLAALAMAFPIVGRFVFDGDMVVILLLTLVFGFAMAAVSYALVENPCRQALRNWEYRRLRRVPPLDSSVTDAPEPVVAQ